MRSLAERVAIKSLCLSSLAAKEGFFGGGGIVRSHYVAMSVSMCGSAITG